MKIVTQPIKQLCTIEAVTKSDGSSSSSHFLKCLKGDGEYYKEVVKGTERVSNNNYNVHCVDSR